MLKPALQLRLGQQLTMTPQLQQAIRLLQLPALDLQQTIREALEQNVMLEADDDGEADASLESSAAVTAAAPPPEDSESESTSDADERLIDEQWGTDPTANTSDAPWSGDDRTQDFSDQSAQTLHEHLLWQLELARLGPRQRAIGRAIIDAINDDGYLIDGVDDIRAVLRQEIETEPAEIEQVLRVVQAFDPAGVGARSVGECIELQLAQLAPDTPGLITGIEIARSHLDLVATQQHAMLRRVLEIDEEELARALALVRSCHPRPGSTIQPSQPDYVVPDVFVRRSQHGWTVDLNSGALPRVRLNEVYVGLVTRAAARVHKRKQRLAGLHPLRARAAARVAPVWAEIA